MDEVGSSDGDPSNRAIPVVLRSPAMRILDDDRPAAHEIGDLRESVGWSRNAGDYPAAYEAFAWTQSARDERGTLVGFCAVLSDRVRHAVLIDVMVHPGVQRRGLGRALVARAVERARERGIELVHVDFTPENEAFYRRCGFRVGLGAILDTQAELPSLRSGTAEPGSSH
jgi:GNAT superfamily N-acetyltransferase